MHRFKLFSLALVLCALVAQPALAKNGHGRGNDDWYEHKNRKERGYDDSGHRSSRRDENDSRIIIQINPHSREVARGYLRESYQRRCPPGLAKKGRHCLPPGHARYQIGDHLPDYYTVVPPYLEHRMGRPPVGTYYAVVDNDIVLVAEASKKIIDAVTLLSAVR